MSCLRIIMQAASSKGLEVYIFHTSDCCLSTAPLFNNLSSTFNHFKVLSINIDQTTNACVHIVVFDKAWESDFNIFHDFAIFNCCVEFHLGEVCGFNDCSSNRLVVWVDNGEFVALMDCLNTEGIALWVAVGPEVVLIKVQSIAVERQSSPVAHTNRFQSSGLAIKQVLISANVAYEVAETWSNSVVNFKPCEKKRTIRYRTFGL